MMENFEELLEAARLRYGSDRANIFYALVGKLPLLTGEEIVVKWSALEEQVSSEKK